MSNRQTLTLDQLDEIHVINCCLSSIADLMIPGDDLHSVNRGDLALLLGYLTDRLRKVTEGAA